MDIIRNCQFCLRYMDTHVKLNPLLLIYVLPLAVIGSDMT